MPNLNYTWLKYKIPKLFIYPFIHTLHAWFCLNTYRIAYYLHFLLYVQRRTRDLTLWRVVLYEPLALWLQVWNQSDKFSDRIDCENYVLRPSLISFWSMRVKLFVPQVFMICNGTESMQWHTCHITTNHNNINMTPRICLHSIVRVAAGIASAKYNQREVRARINVLTHRLVLRIFYSILINRLVVIVTVTLLGTITFWICMRQLISNCTKNSTDFFPTSTYFNA